MKAISAIRASKSLVDEGMWKTGKMPKAAFPLSKSDSYRLGGAWQWRVIKLSSLGVTYRLLIAFQSGKRQYQAWLGVEFGSDQALIARVEFHASHLGWHCHWKTGKIGDVSRGVVKDHGSRERLKHCPSPKDFDQSNALHIAFRVFNVATANAEGLL